MRVTAILIVGVLFASNAEARVGETAEQAVEQYGHPNGSYAGNCSNTITCVYNKDGIQVEATFFTNNVGKNVIGEIKYSLPNEISQSNAVAKVVLLQLLGANAAGQHWEMQNNRPATHDYQRKGAMATMEPTLLTVILDEYAVVVAAARERLVTEQGKQIDEHLKEF
jgi:hypothetical protein